MNEHQVITQLNDGTIEYYNLPQNWARKRSVVIAAIEKNIDNIDYIPEIYYDDFEVMLIAVKINGIVLSKVSTDLIQNYYIVLAAVTQTGHALKYVFDYEIEYEDEWEYEYDSHGPYKTSVERYILDDSRQNLIDKKSIVLAAVKTFGGALEFASMRLKCDKEVVIEAIKNYESSIEFAPVEFKRDKEIITTAIRSNPNAIYTFDLPKLLTDSFSVFCRCSLNKKMDYLLEKIQDGSLLHYSVFWLKKLPDENRRQLMDWIDLNMYDYQKLFNVVFYKCQNFNSQKRLGYFRELPRTILSFLVPEQDVRQKQKMILNDFFCEYQYYV